MNRSSTPIGFSSGSLAKAFEYEKTYQWREARDAFYDTLQLEPEQEEAKEVFEDIRDAVYKTAVT